MRSEDFPKRRYLALWLPLLPTDRLHRVEARAGQRPDDRPLVVVARQGNALRIVASDAAGRGLGLHPGLAFADARARVPLLRVVEHDETADADLLEAIADWCDRYSPLLAVEPPDAIVLDITGVTHLFGGEEELLADLAARLAGQGFTARLAVAGTARAARALARFGEGGVVPAGEEAQRVAGLPVEALEAEAGVTLALRRAGLGRIGEIAARPRRPLAARFGSDLVATLALLLGEIDRPIVPRRPQPLFVAERRFADPIGHMDGIMAALSALAADLCRGLDRHGRGGRHFEAAFFRADGAVRRVEVLSGQPLRVPRTLERLFSMRLDALADPLDPGFGFDMIRLSVLAADAAPERQSGLDGRREADHAVAGLLDRLSARFGAQAVERFVARDTHLPERAARAVPAISGEAGTGSWRAAGPYGVPTRPLFIFRPAQQVDVIAEVPHGPPRRFRWRGATVDVVKAEGPERIAPEWWRTGPESLTRDYFRVEDALGRRFWLFRHGIYGREAGEVRWFLQGLFP